MVEHAGRDRLCFSVHGRARATWLASRPVHRTDGSRRCGSHRATDTRLRDCHIEHAVDVTERVERRNRAGTFVRGMRMKLIAVTIAGGLLFQASVSLVRAQQPQRPAFEVASVKIHRPNDPLSSMDNSKP